jgi:hypothetical protein
MSTCKLLHTPTIEIKVNTTGLPFIGLIANRIHARIKKTRLQFK